MHGKGPLRSGPFCFLLRQIGCRYNVRRLRERVRWIEHLCLRAVAREIQRVGDAVAEVGNYAESFDANLKALHLNRSWTRTA